MVYWPHMSQPAALTPWDGAVLVVPESRLRTKCDRAFGMVVEPNKMQSVIRKAFYFIRSVNLILSSQRNCFHFTGFMVELKTNKVFDLCNQEKKQLNYNFNSFSNKVLLKRVHTGICLTLTSSFHFYITSFRVLLGMYVTCDRHKVARCWSARWMISGVQDFFSCN